MGRREGRKEGSRGGRKEAKKGENKRGHEGKGTEENNKMQHILRHLNPGCGFCIGQGVSWRYLRRNGEYGQGGSQ